MRLQRCHLASHDVTLDIVSWSPYAALAPATTMHRRTAVQDVPYTVDGLRLPPTRARRTVAMWLVGILALAALLRLAWLGSLPAGLSHDEAVKGYDAWSVLHTGRDQYGVRFPLVFRALGDQREALLPYLIVASEAALGPTDVAVRLPTALAGIALVGALFLLGRAAFGPVTGLIAAALLAVSPWHVQVSRLAFRAGLLPLTTILGLW